MEYKFLFSVILGIFLIASVSAGLDIQTNQTIDVEKTPEEIVNFSITIKNTETFSFFNISFETNPFIEMEEINELVSGANVTFIANVKGSIDFNGEIRIKGFYESNIGQNFDNHTIIITYPDGVDECDLTFVKGDRVTWNNTVLDSVVMRNTETNNIITTIAEGTTHKILFDSPQVLKYRLERIGLPFTPVCTITALDDSGPINNPLLDGVINLNLQINFPETNLDLILLTSSYTINAGSSKSDLFKITNNGNDIARDVFLSGNWFSFTENNFDLGPGEEKILGYTITPLIAHTNDTDKNYVKNITVTGNFEEISKEINIFIPFSTVTGETNQTISLDSLVEIYLQVLESYCSENINKNTEVCQEFRQSSVFFSQNGTTENDLLIEIAKKLIELSDNQRKFENTNKLFQNQTSSEINSTNTKIGNVEGKIDGIGSKIDMLVDSILIIGFSLSALIIGGTAMFLIFGERRKNKLKQAERVR